MADNWDGTPDSCTET